MVPIANRNNHKGLIALLLSSACLFLVACGGGSSGGAGGTDASSTVVLDVSDINGVTSIEKLRGNTRTSNLVGLFDVFLLKTWASHISIFLNGTNFGNTSEDESFVIAVTAGTYEVTFVSSEPALICSDSLTIADDQIVYWDNITISGTDESCEVTKDERIENVSDDLISGGDNAPEGKTLVCHKNKNEISVSPNAVRAHLAHGDTTGPCPS